MGADIIQKDLQNILFNLMFNFILIFFNTIVDCGFVITIINSIAYFFCGLNIFFNNLIAFTGGVKIMLISVRVLKFICW